MIATWDDHDYCVNDGGAENPVKNESKQLMLDFFGELKKSIPDAKFLFITQDSRQSVFKIANDSGIDTADIIVQPASRKEVPLYLAISDWSIFFIKDAYSKKASSPTKQGEIMAMGIPLVCNDIGDTGKIIEASGAGLIVRGFVNVEYLRIISQLSELQGKKKEDRRNAAFEYYDLQKGVQSYLKVYKKMQLG